MANIFEIPKLNSLRAIWQSDVLPSDGTIVKYNAFNPQYNNVHFDDDFFCRSIRFFEQKVGYLQPYQQSDTIRYIFFGSDTTAANYTARLLDMNGVAITKTITVSQQSGTYSGLKAYTLQFSLWDVPEGKYFLQLAYDHGASTFSYILHEPFHLKQVHSNTVRIDYRNSYNDQDVIYFSDTFKFQLRVKGNMSAVNPDSKFSTYEDQPLNNTMVSGIPYRNFELTIDKSPEWLADKVERIFLTDTLTIDGKLFSRENGAKLEPKRNEQYPLHFYGLKLREAENKLSNEYAMNTAVMGSMPQTKYFWVEQMTIAGTTTTIRQGFNGKRNFLDYLNSNQQVGNGYWGEDAKNQLVFYGNNDFTISSTWVLTPVNVLMYGMKLTLIGAGDLEIDVVSSASTQYYAAKWGGGITSTNKTALTASPTATNIAESWAVTYKRECYLYFSDYASIQDIATNVNILSIDCDIAPSCTYFNPFMNATGCTQFESNPFNYVVGLEYFDVQNMNMHTYAIDDLIRWIYEKLPNFDASCSCNLQSQQSLAPPTNGYGMGILISTINDTITYLGTD